MPMFKKVDACRVCEGMLTEVLAYEPLPLVNSYCDPEPHEDDYYPLTLMVCKRCDLVQVREEVPENVLYLREYPYVPSTSQTMVQHFDELAAAYAKPGQLVVDIGSSDGTLLSCFQKRGCEVFGIDPAKNLVQVANERGIPSIAECFDDSVAEWLETWLGDRIAEWAGKKPEVHFSLPHRPDVITATNVVANAHQMMSFLRGVRRLLKPDGVFVMETPNFLKLMELGSYDSVYHEHMVYFTPATLEKALKVAGLTMVRLEEIPIHGGSLRATVKVGEERLRWLDGTTDFGAFVKRVDGVRHALQVFLRQASLDGKSVVGYTAPAKATVLLSQAGMDPSWMQYAVDNIPYKQGKLLPGLHIEIRPPEALDEGPVPDYLLVHAWNFRDEILPKLQPYMAAGAQAVIPVPRLEVLDG